MPSHDLEIAKAAFAAGDISHAVFHLGQHFAEDPRSMPGFELLVALRARVKDPLELVPLTPPSTPAPVVALRAYFLEQQGQLDLPVRMMAEIFNVMPGLPYLPWVADWLQRDERVSQVTPEAMAFLLSAIGRRVPQEAAPPAIECLSGMMPVFVRYQAAHPSHPPVAGFTSALVRKLGRPDIAERIAQESYERQPDYFTAVTWANALREQGKYAAALNAHRKALAQKPEDIYVRLDMADMLCDTGQLAEGVAVYQEVLAREAQHPWAWPSYLYYQQYLQPGDDWYKQLKALAQAPQSNERANYLLNQHARYISFLPEPSDATINVIRQVIDKDYDASHLEIGLSSLEAPSASLSIELYQLERYGKAQLTVTIADIQRPDPRLPRGAVDYCLWVYDGTRPQRNIGAPAAHVAEAVRALAATPYHRTAWMYTAEAIAEKLSVATIPDLLGVMLYPPPRPAHQTMWGWLQAVQFAATFIIARLGHDWAGSERRRALLALARGPMDWTVGAAITALGYLGQTLREAAADIDAEFLELFAARPRPGGVPYDDALLFCAAQLPSPSPQLRRVIDAAIEVWKTARKQS